ncbi:MAG: hypothetical protein MR959_02430 [Selenomonas bovis]|nr:hypothetical protein [Selenomonas bovis]
MDDSQELLHELLRELADIRSDINKDGNSKERELVNMLYVLLRFLQKVHFGDTDSAWGGPCGDIVSDINVFLLLAVLIDVILWAVYWYRATGFSHFAGY